MGFSTISDWGIDLHYCDFEWFALERKRVHSAILATASKYFILDSSVDYERYSISSKVFLLRVAGKSPTGAQECGEVGGVAAQETGTRFPLASVAYVFGNFTSFRSHVPCGTHFPSGV